jgi:beta-carotene hydroxylase
MSFLGSLAEGVVFQPRIWIWAMKHASQSRRWIVGEGLACLALVASAIALVSMSPVFLVYVVIMIMGSWVFPLFTSYIPHNASGEDELHQTRAFRGKIASVIALEHLYHLEHHLYPAVPHHNCARLAKRLDPFLERAGVRSIKLWF